jgi:predicted metal-binding protein
MDKFSKLIAQGVAKFEYTPIAPEVPTQCAVCRAYNNVYSIANDTRMSELPDGRHVITGSVIKDKRKFDNFLYSPFYSGINFMDSGLGAPCTFFYNNGLKGHYDVLNGDVVYILEKMPEEQEAKIMACPDCACCSESRVPMNLRFLTTDNDARHIMDCFKQPDVAKALNENRNVVGENWVLVGLSDGDHFVSVCGNKAYIL